MYTSKNISLNANLIPNAYVIRLVGLLDKVPRKNFFQYCQQFERNGYTREKPYESERDKEILRDMFYPEFRKIMFSSHEDNDNVRYQKLVSEDFNLKLFLNDSFLLRSISVVHSEIFLFRGNIGLFSLDLKFDNNLTLGDISSILNKIRLFNAIDNNNVYWHQWISSKFLCGIQLRSTNEHIAQADEFSGSKFKLYTVFDIDQKIIETEDLLYELGTVSPIGAVKGDSIFSPSSDYFKQIMESKLSVFKNWHSICLFDSFCTIGNNFLLQYGTESINKSWSVSYFRIYIFRIFFKYNIYNYSSLIANDDAETAIKYRNQYEMFLNKYNISYISFNFLPNLLYEKIGISLELKPELETFRERINQISSYIAEEKQGKTNTLLKAVTALTGIGFVSEFIEFVKLIEETTSLSRSTIYLFFLVFVIGLFLLGYLYIEQKRVIRWMNHLKNIIAKITVKKIE